jgi:hypothetical protein
MKEISDQRKLSLKRAKAAVLFRSSIPPARRHKLKAEFANSPGTKRAPVLRVFSDLCPDKLKEAEDLSLSLFSGTSKRNPYLYDLLNFTLGRISLQQCPTCSDQFLSRSIFCSKRCGQVGKTSSVESKLKRNATRSSPEYSDRLAAASRKQSRTMLSKSPAEKARSQKSSERTCTKRYGFRNAVMASAVFRKVSKSGRRFYHGQYSDGTLVSAQGGSEKLFVSAAIKRGYDVRNPDFSIKYRFTGRSSAYHPDFLIEDPETGGLFLIEVKSVYTLFSRGFDRNCAKFVVANRWCKQQGATFILCVVGRSKGSFDFLESPTRSRVLKEFPDQWRALSRQTLKELK